jgi:hypothetical protein
MRDGSIRGRDGKPFKPSTARKYEAALRLLIVPRIGAVPVTTLTGGDVQRLVDALAAEQTPEHARKALTALRVALRVCARYGELAGGNPCAGVRVPVSAEGEKKPTILTPEQAAAIVVAAEAEDERLGRSFAGPLIALAFGSGLRLGELLALAYGPDGLDLETGIVHVSRALDPSVALTAATRSSPRSRGRAAARSRSPPKRSPACAATGSRPAARSTASSSSTGPTGRRSPPSPPTGPGSASAASRSTRRRRRAPSCRASTTPGTPMRPACSPPGSAHTRSRHCSAMRTRPWSTAATATRSRTSWPRRARG